jgi:hypothetical protein
MENNINKTIIINYNQLTDLSCILENQVQKINEIDTEIARLKADIQPTCRRRRISR